MTTYKRNKDNNSNDQRSLDLELNKKDIKRLVWSVALYGANIWTLSKIYYKYLESLKYGYEKAN